MTGSTKDMIKKYNIRLIKTLGQNFLTDNAVISRIVDAADIDRNDAVIEVGPGIGSMTSQLASQAGRVTAIEIDRYLIPALKENLAESPNVTLINDDIMKVDLKQIVSSALKPGQDNVKPERVKVVANLPYYITTPIIMKFLEEDLKITAMVFMVQKEVAERMAAAPGSKDYGALSVAVQYYAHPEKVFDVPPHCFIPQPDVHSTVIRLKVYDTPPVVLKNKEMFFKTIKAAFGQRRKTLVNALCNSGYYNQNKEEMKEILKGIGIGENDRGEILSIMQFAELSNSFSKNSL